MTKEIAVDAETLVRVPMSKSRLRELAQKYPPPQEWHEEDLDIILDETGTLPSRDYSEPNSNLTLGS